MIRAPRPSSLRLGAALVAAAMAAACTASAPAEPVVPAFAGPGRFVRDPVPVTTYRSCCYSIDLTADTLWLDAGGAARRVVVTRKDHFPYDPRDPVPPYDSTRTDAWAGAWQASGPAVRVVLALGTRADTLPLVSRADGGLQTTSPDGTVFARR